MFYTFRFTSTHNNFFNAMNTRFVIAIFLHMLCQYSKMTSTQAELIAISHSRYLQRPQDLKQASRKEDYDHHHHHHPKHPHTIEHHHHKTIVKEFPVPEPVPVRVPVRVPVQIPVNVPFKVPVEVPLRVPVVKYFVNTIRDTKWINGPSSHVAVKDTKTTAVGSNSALRDHTTAIGDRRIAASNTATALKDSQSASSDKMVGISDTVTPAGGVIAGGGGGGVASGDIATAARQDLLPGDVEQPPVPLSTPVPNRR